MQDAHWWIAVDPLFVSILAYSITILTAIIVVVRTCTTMTFLEGLLWFTLCSMVSYLTYRADSHIILWGLGGTTLMNILFYGRAIDIGSRE